MGYATDLYLVDLAVLNSMIGSHDAGLRDRLRERILQIEGPSAPPTIGILVTLEGEIYVNGNQMSPEELQVELAKPEHAGKNLSYYKRQATNAEEGRRKGSGKFPSDAKFFQFLQSAIGNSGVRYGFLSSCSSEAAFLDEADDELTIEEAVDHLVFGRMDASSESAHQYGYALEYACREASVAQLVVEGKRRLAHFKVKSKLFQSRCPVAIPAYDDFPEIGHLSSQEAASELKSVFSTDKLSPLDSAIHEEREQVISLVNRAANECLSLIGFYY